MITASSNSPIRESGLGPAGLRFRSILAATDCSPASANAVKLAARLAKEFHARLYVLHAIAPEMYSASLCGPIPELELMNLDTAHKNLHEYVEHLPDLRSVKHKELVFLGSAADGIQSAGKANGIDLLVLGSHGRKGLAKLTLGSVAEWAIRRLTYPVLVAGPACDRSMLPIQSIMMATDLTEHAQRSARYAASLGQDYNSKITVMTVLAPFETTQAQVRAEESAKRSLHQLFPSDCSDRCTLKYEVKLGEIAPAILQTAQENKANLIVLGARHRPPLSDHRPRTKLAAIIRSSRCPVLVVPAETPDLSSVTERKSL
jgi:nucleotide-binding universal stress UspA family protein